MDLSLDLGEYKLNVRAGIVIVHNNKVLTHKSDDKDHYALPGGRIEVGENSEETVKREIFEEMGREIEIEGYVATIENFFVMEGKKYHELYFLYKGEFKNEEDRKIEYTLNNEEGNDYLHYEWLDLSKIDEYNILPGCLKDILKMKQLPVHMVNDDMKK